MLHIAIIDDEEKWRKATENCVCEHFQGKEITIDRYPSGLAFLEKNQAYDIVVVDIEMPELDGFETTVRYHKAVPEALIIILTTHTELSRRGYTVNAFRYIDKLSMQEELTEALDSAEEKLKRYRTIPVNVVNMGELDIVINDILYIETVKRNVLIHTNRGDYSCSNTITQLEADLGEYGFYRCHKSYVVNLSCIEKINSSEVFLRGGDSIVISVKRVTELKKQYYDWKCQNASK